jgi:hypothetical protein
MTVHLEHEFSLDRERAAADLRGPEDALWPVNAYSDADELNDLLEAAQNSGLITARRAARLYVYPLSIRERDPLLALSPSVGPIVLGREVRLDQDEEEDPITFTLRLLDHAVERGNALLAEALADSRCLDRIAAYVSRLGPQLGASIREHLIHELRSTGRPMP